MIESINKFKGILLFPVLCFTFFMCGTVSAKNISTVSTEYKGALTVIPNVYVQHQFVNVTYDDSSTSRYAAYCFESNKLEYQSTTNLHLTKNITDIGYFYISEHGYQTNHAATFSGATGTETTDYYITQMALWWYQDLVNGVPDSSDGSLEALFKNGTYSGDSKTIHDAIKSFAYAAKSYHDTGKTIDTSLATISLSSNPSSKMMTYDSTNKLFSASVTATTNGTFNGFTYDNIIGFGSYNKTVNGKTTTIEIPKDNINGMTGKITVKATASKNISKLYLYGSDDTSRQNLFITSVTPSTASSEITLNLARTALRIKKVDENGNGVAGAKLKLLYNGSLIESWTSTTGEKEFWDIPEGNLTLVEETAPAGFIKASNKTIKIVRNGTMQTENMVNKKTKIQVLKTDEKGNSIAGAKMKLTDSAGNVHTWTTTIKAYALSGVAIGKCTIEEIEAPSGYVLDTKKQICEIKNVETVQTFTFKNTKNQVEISKQDATTGKELPGATLVLKTAAGKEIDKWVSSDKPHVITGLAKGMYVLEETIAPEGYIKSTEKVMFQINEKGLVEDKVVMKNQPTKIIVSKKDSKVKKTLLEGAKLQLKNSKGEVIATWTTTKEAYTIEKLVVDETYTLEELVAPTGYDKAKPVTFKVEEKESQEIVMYDSLTVIDVPDTGSFTSIMIYIIGGLLITAGIVGTVLYVNNIKKRRSV